MIRLCVAFVAVVTALAVARLASSAERRYVWPCAVALALNWAWYATAFLPAPYAPTWVIYNLTGAVIDPVTLWTIADTLTAIWVITKAWERFWGIGLHALYIVQIVIEIAPPGYWNGRIDDVLSVVFYLQIACLLAGGWDGIQDRIARVGALLRRRHGVRHRMARQEVYQTIEQSPLIQRIKSGG